MSEYEDDFPHESRSVHSQGFRYHQEHERDEADRWLDEHADELPSQRAGEFIGSDAIRYIGNRKLLARLIERFGTVQPKEETRPTEAEILRAIRKFKFTKRQQQIIRLLAHGKSEEEISHKLGISQDAVRKQFGRIWRRKGVTDPRRY